MKREHRAAPVTETEGDGRTFMARAVSYDVVDDYQTRFIRGVFAESLSRRMPVITWSHDWSEPVGRVESFEEKDDGLYITARLSDPDAVPRARQAMSQLAEGVIRDVSVGFLRRESRKPDKNGVVDITKADLDEVALTLRGAVPGAQVLAVRSAGMVTEDQWVLAAKKLAAGEVTEDEAKAMLRLAATENETSPDAPESPESDETGGEAPEDQANDSDEITDAELDAAIESLGRSARR